VLLVHTTVAGVVTVAAPVALVVVRVLVKIVAMAIAQVGEFMVERGNVLCFSISKQSNQT